jgi:Amt family ammonium transporter
MAANLGPGQLSPFAAGICGLLILLIPLACAGLALMNSGLGRSRSAMHSVMASLTVIGVASMVFVICGGAFQGFPGRAAFALTAGGKDWNWIGAGRLFFGGLDFDDGANPGGTGAALAACFGMFGAALAAVIPLGAGAERWRLSAAAVSTAVLAGWTYPLFAHWVWGGGWLAELGSQFKLGAGFVDAGGAGTIQVVGGLSALSVSWLLGARRGKFSGDGMPTALPGHNAVFVTFGALLALIGWFGLNSSAAILFYGAAPARIGLIGVNTLLSAGSALLAAALVTRTRYGKPDASLSANGWTAGLAASSAGAAFQVPAEALMVGLVAGALVTLSIEWLELHLKIDDPGGSISVHAIGGLWGLLAAGFLGRFPGTAGDGQWAAQLTGVATLVGFMFPMIYGLNWTLDRMMRFRVALDGERHGMDLHELGANAYPELVSHLEDFPQR